MMKIEKSLKNMDDYHRALISDTLGNDFLEKSQEDLITEAGELLFANKKLAEELYGKDLQEALWSNNQSEIKRLYENRVVNNILEKKKISKNIDLSKFGVLVVRPELMAYAPECLDLLKKHGLEVLFEKDSVISFNQYWGMYNVGLKFNDPIETLDFPTRTANYINLPCHVILLKSEFNIDIPVSDYLQEIKGRAGYNNPGTFRGDIARAALSSVVLNNGKNLSKEVRVALDPIGMYRGLVNGRINSDSAHVGAESQILHYVGQGVHIPDNSELSNDLKILLSQDEIDSMG